MGNNKAKTTELEDAPLLSLSEARDLLDIAYLINALLRSGGNVSGAAEELGIGRRTIYEMMNRFGVSCSNGKLSMQITPLASYLELRIPYVEKYAQ